MVRYATKMLPGWGVYAIVAGFLVLGFFRERATLTAVLEASYNRLHEADFKSTLAEMDLTQHRADVFSFLCCVWLFGAG